MEPLTIEVTGLTSALEQALGSASSALARAAVELGAGAVAVFLVTGSDVEISYFWSATGDSAPGSRFPLVAKLDVDALGARSGAVEAGSPLGKLLQESISRDSQSFLLFPWRVRRQVVSVVFGFSTPQPRHHQVPDAIVEKLNLIGLATWSVREVAKLHTELHRLNSRLAGRKVVERAKGVLQVEQGLSEESAYAYLRGQSRKRRITLAAFAEEVLRRRGSREEPFPPAALIRDRA